MSLSVTQIVLLTINFNFLVFGIFLFNNKNGNVTSNKILAFAMMLLVYVNTHFVLLYDRQVYLTFPHLIGTHAPFLFLLPPLLFFFYKSVFDTSFNISRISILHLIPAALVLLSYVPLYFSSIDYKINFIQTGVCYIPFYLLGGMFFTHFLVYQVVIIWDTSRIIHTSKKSIGSYLVNYFKTARILTISLMVILMITIALKLNLIYIPILTSIVYYFVLYQILVHPEIFFTCKFATLELVHKKYQSNELPSEVINQIYEQTKTHIYRKKVYLNVKITLPELSYQLEIPAHQLSQAINRKSNLNFNDFINKFRAEHCKGILLDDNYNHYTMEAIGELSGFNSRQTFIKSFKKFYNQTPSEFMKLNKQTA